MTTKIEDINVYTYSVRSLFIINGYVKLRMLIRSAFALFQCDIYIAATATTNALKAFCLLLTGTLLPAMASLLYFIKLFLCELKL